MKKISIIDYSLGTRMHNILTFKKILDIAHNSCSFRALQEKFGKFGGHGEKNPKSEAHCERKINFKQGYVGTTSLYTYVNPLDICIQDLKIKLQAWLYHSSLNIG